MNKDSESLHSALVVKTEICEKTVFLNETYLINDQNVNISPIQINIKFLSMQALKIYKKSYPVVGVWSCQRSQMTISELCRSTVEAQCGMRL